MTSAAAHAGLRLNPVARENARRGTTAWLGPTAPGRSIEGYTSEVSAAPGQLLHFHVSTTPGARYRIRIFRLGWYRRLGARSIACLPRCGRDEQGSPMPVGVPDPQTGLLRATWPVTDTIRVGRRWVSGYYLARLQLTSGSHAGAAAVVPLIVRAQSRQRPSTILVQASVNTWQAYNDWGGISLYHNYTGLGDNHVAFDRPYDPSAPGPLLWEIQLVRFLEREGYDVSYTTDADTDRQPNQLLHHRLVMTAGHDEYWTKRMRDAFEHARDSGVNLAFMGANTGFWQIRYEDSRRTIVEYRKATRDPEPDPALKTTMFRRLVPPRPECELLGVAWSGGIGASRALKPQPTALADRWFAGTGFVAGSSVPGLVGYEWDTLQPGCSVPHLTVLFHTDGEPANADAVRYLAPSGAIVFATGTLQFSWGLDGFGGHQPDPRLQRFMRNALADLTASVK